MRFVLRSLRDALGGIPRFRRSCRRGRAEPFFREEHASIRSSAIRQDPGLRLRARDREGDAGAARGDRRDRKRPGAALRSRTRSRRWRGSGALLTRVTKVFFNLAASNTNDAIQKIRAEEEPKLAKHQDAIYLNAKLYARVKALYDKRDTLGLDAESRYLLHRYHLGFVRAGAELDTADQAKLRALNEEEAKLTTRFRGAPARRHETLVRRRLGQEGARRIERGGSRVGRGAGEAARARRQVGPRPAEHDSAARPLLADGPRPEAADPRGLGGPV